MVRKKEINSNNFIQAVESGTSAKEIMKKFGIKNQSNLNTFYLDALVEKGRAKAIVGRSAKIDSRLNTVDSVRKKENITCFISAPVGITLSKIKRLLHEKNIESIVPSEVISLGQPIFEKVSELISRSDLFLAVLNNAPGSMNTYFELGVASAKKKHIVIISPDTHQIPFDLRGVLSLITDVEYLEPLEFVIDQIIAAPKKRKITSKNRVQPTERSNLFIQTDELLNRLNFLNLGEVKNELENIVTNILNESDVTIVKQPKIINNTPDLAIWSDELDTILGNPIIIEIKENIRGSNHIKIISDRIQNYLEKTNSKFALVFFLKGIGPENAKNLANINNILFFQLEEFIQQLKYHRFAEVVRRKRNFLAHGETL